MNIIGIIPARYASSRFPGKPLIKIGEKTMIERVYAQASKILDNVLVATDDEKIYAKVRDFGGNVIMTSVEHKSGTDRCAEAVSLYSKKVNKSFDIVVNIQGDEPFIQPEQIKELIDCFSSQETQIATLAKKTSLQHELFDPNVPKVIFDKTKRAVYFSRNTIPYVRNIAKEKWAEHSDFYKHIGLYAYRTEILYEITRLRQSALEMAESLEQNRWIENAYTIRVEETEFESFGIDTPEDLEKAIKAGLDK